MSHGHDHQWCVLLKMRQEKANENGRSWKLTVNSFNSCMEGVFLLHVLVGSLRAIGLSGSLRRSSISVPVASESPSMGSTNMNWARAIVVWAARLLVWGLLCITPGKRALFASFGGPTLSAHALRICILFDALACAALSA